MTPRYNMPSTDALYAFQNQPARLATPAIQPSNSASPAALQPHRFRSSERPTGLAQAVRPSPYQGPTRAALPYRQNHLSLSQAPTQTPIERQGRSSRPPTTRWIASASERAAIKKARKEAADEKRRKRTEQLAVWKEKREDQKTQLEQEEEKRGEEQLELFKSVSGGRSVDEEEDANQEENIDDEDNANEDRLMSEEED